MDVCESTQGSVSVLNVAVWLAHGQLGQLAQAYLIWCHKLREVYWKAIVEVAGLEQLLNGDVAPETIYGLDTQLEAAEQARRAARDELNRSD